MQAVCFLLELIYSIRGISSSGRAPALQAGGDRFESDILHQERVNAGLLTVKILQASYQFCGKVRVLS